MQLAVLFVRVIVGGVLVVTGALKVGHAPELAAAIAGFRLLPPDAVALTALLLPFAEILIGGYLLLGLFTYVTAWATSAMFLIYGAAIASAVIRGIPANCGCFGPNDTAIADWPHVFFDVLFAALAVFIAIYAPGAFALDRRLKKK